jgi:hypothetical protein
MKRLSILIALPVLTGILLSCNHTKSSVKTEPLPDVSTDKTATTDTLNAALDTVVLNLLELSAGDFYKHQPPLPDDFRNVKFGYLEKSDGRKNYLICGEFRSRNTNQTEEWMDFATIQTDPYEQWIGSIARTYCQESKEIPYTTLDLSLVLKEKLKLIQK